MKKRWKIFLFIGIILTLLVLIARLTGILGLYNVSSAGNQPAINPGDKMITTKLIHPKKFELAMFRNTISEIYLNESWVFRLMAEEGDTIEMIHGDCFVNSRFVDNKINRKLSYKISHNDLRKYNQKLKEGRLTNGNLEQQVFDMQSDSVMVTLDESLVREFHFQYFKRYEKPFIQSPEYPTWVGGLNWTPSHFGPYIIPLNHVFVMGDNRDNANDSRFLGPIKKRDVEGTVIKIY